MALAFFAAGMAAELCTEMERFIASAPRKPELNQLLGSIHKPVKAPPPWYICIYIYIYIWYPSPPPPRDLPFFALSQVTQLHCKQSQCAT